MRTTTTTAKCDVRKEVVCGKYEIPPDPWTQVSVSAFWMSTFGKDVASERHACSPKCAVTVLETTAAKLKEFIARFPSASGWT